MTNGNSVDKISLLSQAFDGLSDDDLRELAGMTRLFHYPPGHTLCLEGAFEEVFYIIAEGQVRITKKISDSEGEREIRVIGPGGYVGEMSRIKNSIKLACKLIGEVQGKRTGKSKKKPG